MVKVDLSQKGITSLEAQLLAPTLRSAAHIEELKLCYNALQDEGAAAVAAALGSHMSLHTLDLGFNAIGDAGALALSRGLMHNRTLHTLYLSGNSIGQEGTRALAQALKHDQRYKGLHTLHLTGNKIGTGGVEALAEALQSNVSLEKLYIGGGGVGVAGACALAAALASNSTLQYLYLGANKIGDQGLFSLAQSLQNNRSMVLLELSFNAITAAGVESLANSLWGYMNLRALHLDNNQMGDQGAAHVAAVLPTLQLEHLDLGFNGISTVGITSIMKALVVGNSTVRSLILSGNKVDAAGAKAIAYTVAQPTCGLRKLSLDHTNLGHVGEKRIAAGILNNRALCLENFTGFRLGVTFVEQGMPSQMSELSNEQALDRVRASWHLFLERQAEPGSGPQPQSQLPQEMPRTFVGVSPRRAGTEAAAAQSGDRSPSPASLAPCNSTGASSGRSRPRRVSRSSSIKSPANGPPNAASGQTVVLTHAAMGMDMGMGGMGMAMGTLPPSFDCLPRGEVSSHLSQPGSHMQAHIGELQEIKNLPFDAAELWTLHQYYFSPPPTVSASSCSGQSPCDELSDGAAHHHDRDHYPPSKRQANLRTKTRISYLPRLKAHIEGLKGAAGEYQVLTLLRQLKYMECAVAAEDSTGSLDTTSGDDESDRKTRLVSSMSAADDPALEALLLDHL